MSQLTKKRVIEKLTETFPDGLYTERNVVLSSTHTHSGPAGYMQYLLFNIPNLGFVQDALDAFVNGIVKSIVRAHESMQPGKLRLGKSEVMEEANINRSPTSYLANPPEERARYASDTDKGMVQVNFLNLAEEPLGVLNWYAVHPTSMNYSNHLISGDNKGAASQMFEKMVNPESLAGEAPFVASFASTNLGDVSPNILGPKCIDTGLPCDLEHSTCEGRTQNCIASGPGVDMFDSTKIIAERQLAVSWDLLYEERGQTEIEGPLQFIHQWINMSNFEVNLSDGSKVSTCPPAMGYSFAAGTTDGPGEFDFVQGELTGNPFWDFVSHLLKEPTPEQVACHAPKPILLDTGELDFPYPWHPSIVDTQVIRLGDLYILAVPGEFTTMSGRRLREAVEAGLKKMLKDEAENSTVVIAGLSNSYTHYVATYEEYQKQRYEAASTIYGPHTLEAYMQQYRGLVEDMVAGNSIEAGTPPPDLGDSQISFVPGVVLDSPGAGMEFGDCILEPVDSAPGTSVSATFVSGHLRNDMLLESSFLMVERQVEGGEWELVARDAEWETKLEWVRTNVLSGESNVIVTWDIPYNTPEGTYRLGHRGYHKNIVKGILPYSGYSNTFQVSNSVQVNIEEDVDAGFFGNVFSFIERFFKLKI